MNNAIGRILAILMLVWATISSAQTVVVLGGVNTDMCCSSGFGGEVGTDEQVMENVTVPPGYVITSVTTALSKGGSPNDNVVIEVRQGGVLLSSASASGASLDNSFSERTYTLSSPAITTSPNISIVLTRSGSGSNANYYKVRRGAGTTSFGGVEHGGMSFFRNGGWVSPSAGIGFAMALSGYTTPLAQATPVPNSLGFGDVNTGLTSQLTLKIKNTGTAVMSISGVVSSNPLFTVSPAIPPSVNVNVGDSTTVTVGFTPTSAGSASGNITMNHNGVNSPAVIAMTGNGVATGGGGSSSGGSVVTGPVAFSVTSVDIGSTNTGGSASRTVYLRNPTSGVIAIGLATTNSEFGVSPVSASVPANDSLLVTVSFTPASAGSKSATLVASYGSGSTASAVFTGTGTGTTTPVPVLTVSSTNYSADSTIVRSSGSSFTIPLQNTGGSNLFITSMYIGGSSTAFTLSGPSAITIAPGETYNASVIFSPQVVGSRTATLNINHNGQGGSSSVFLSGVGKDPPPQARPTINIIPSSLAGSPPYSIFFRNENLGGSVTLSDWQITRLSSLTNSREFKSFRQSGYRDTLTYVFTEVGAYVVEAEFEGPGGADHQPMSDTIWIATRDANIVASQEIVGLPPVELGKGSSTAKFSISNTGDVGTEVFRYRVGGLDSLDFRVLTEPNFTISPNSTKDIWVEFTPTRTIGDKQTYVYLYFVGLGSPIRVKLSSTATDPPWGPASVVDFSVNARQGVDSLEVQFTYKLEGLRYSSHVMYFGDGDSSIVNNPTHVYRTRGKYSPSLVVTLVNGEKVSPKTKEEYIQIVRLPPSPDFTGDKRIDFADFFLFVEQTDKVEHTPQELARFDLDGDNFINNNDFFIFADHFGETVP